MAASTVRKSLKVISLRYGARQVFQGVSYPATVEGLQFFARPGEPVPFRKFRDGQRAFRPHLAAVDRPKDVISQAVKILFRAVEIANCGQFFALLLSRYWPFSITSSSVLQKPTSPALVDESLFAP